jgi:hypothetical protein
MSLQQRILWTFCSFASLGNLSWCSHMSSSPSGLNSDMWKVPDLPLLLQATDVQMKPSDSGQCLTEQTKCPAQPPNPTQPCLNFWCTILRTNNTGCCLKSPRRGSVPYSAMDEQNCCSDETIATGLCLWLGQDALQRWTFLKPHVHWEWLKDIFYRCLVKTQAIWLGCSSVVVFDYYV